MAVITAKGAKARGSSVPWVLGVGCGFLFAVSMPTAVLMAVTFTPAMLVAGLDQRGGKYAARPTALFSLAMVIPLLPGLWMSGHSVSSALKVIGDVNLLMAIALAGFVGWAIARLVPTVASIWIEKKATASMTTIRERIASLKEEWDEVA